jgi:hypothetical protein
MIQIEKYREKLTSTRELDACNEPGKKIRAIQSSLPQNIIIKTTFDSVEVKYFFSLLTANFGVNRRFVALHFSLINISKNN